MQPRRDSRELHRHDEGMHAYSRHLTTVDLSPLRLAQRVSPLVPSPPTCLCIRLELTSHLLRTPHSLLLVTTGVTANPGREQHTVPAPSTFPQHPHATSLPSPMMLQHMPGYLNSQQLQSMLLLNQHPAMFRNPVLQSQLAMLMWSQMQHPPAPLWTLPQPANVMQPAPVQQQPQSLAAQSASTHQPSNAGATFEALKTAPSLECNSSGGSNDSGCMQTPNTDTLNAQQSPSPDKKLGRSAFDSSSRFADDSDSAVTWAGKAEQQAQQLGFRSASISHPEARGKGLLYHRTHPVEALVSGLGKHKECLLCTVGHIVRDVAMSNVSFCNSCHVSFCNL